MNASAVRPEPTDISSLLSARSNALHRNPFTEYADEIGLIRSPAIGASASNAIPTDRSASG